MKRQDQIKEMAKFNARCLTCARWRHGEVATKRLLTRLASGLKNTPQKFEDVQNYVEQFRKAMNED